MQTPAPGLAAKRVRRLSPLPGDGAAARIPKAPSWPASTLDHPQSAQTLAADGGSLKRVLKQAGVTKDSVVRVTGPAGPAAATWLYRHGYEHAAYVPADWVAAKSSADVLLIPHACATEELADLLQSGDCLHRRRRADRSESLRTRSAPGFDSVAADASPARLSGRRAHFGPRARPSTSPEGPSRPDSGRRPSDDGTGPEVRGRCAHQSTGGRSAADAGAVPAHLAYRPLFILEPGLSARPDP